MSSWGAFKVLGLVTLFSWHLSCKWIKWPRDQWATSLARVWLTRSIKQKQQKVSNFLKFNQMILKRFFWPFRILDWREVDVIFRCYFCFKKKSYKIRKRKNTTLVDRTVEHTSPQFYPRGGRGTLGISGWGCATGTLKPLTYTIASSAGFCYPILE